ncbi:dimethylarginine dimethylaminohydrolase family protein [Halobacillus sp. Marseille-P3879]|uniref:dimethylarginine dimethylaminohydrolase family protein n=1 Tax=Halobacillus sp. Marseille-P3879 TaxID=2045014 RepID=UPI000C7A8044|nr:arginine deiminase family protein [Halobacillus sp. Marseille-P3879]
MQTKNANSNQSKGCRNEYDALKKVLVSKPEHMKITEVINETQKHYESENINVDRAMEQHRQFVKVLESNNIEVEYLPVRPKLNEQVFTRDIGFCIGDQVFVASLESELRQEEVNPLLDFLEKENLSFTRLFGPSIEGGDVIINHGTIYVGISGRTTMAAVEHLQKALPAYEVVPIKLREDILHLDCAFNILDEHTALIHSPALEANDAKRLKQSFDCIEVDETEQFYLGTNVLSIGQRLVISLPQNTNVNQKLKDAGFIVIEVDLSEIIKSGGAFRCCTLPIARKS